MPKPVELVNFNELPMKVYDMPAHLVGVDEVGWGFIKKIARDAKNTFKKATKPVRRIARTAMWPARKTYKAVVPAQLRRSIDKAAKKSWRLAKKFGKYALLPVAAIFKVLELAAKALVKKYFVGAIKKITRRRARYLSYQRRGSTRPTNQEMMEAARWARKYAKSQGLFGKLLKAALSMAQKLAKDPNVRKRVSAKVIRKRGPRVSGDYVVGAEPATLTIISASIPIIIKLINAFLNRAAKQGAPVDPRQASPEQNLLPELAQGYMRASMRSFTQPGGYQANIKQTLVREMAPAITSQLPGDWGQVASAALQTQFQPPQIRQPAMTFNYPEPEPQQFDFPAPPQSIDFQFEPPQPQYYRPQYYPPRPQPQPATYYGRRRTYTSF